MHPLQLSLGISETFLELIKKKKKKTAKFSPNDESL
jgi:hypothetical protein